MPTTEAGKRLQEVLRRDSHWAFDETIEAIEAEAFAAGMRHEQALQQDAMLAHAEMADYFEAEAVAAERARIRAAVKAAPVLVLPTGAYIDVEYVFDAIDDA